jgi:2-C-methyl-D-erythritol 4-phosphate cytidylyltransferase
VRAGADGALPGIPIADTIKRVDTAGVVTATIPRRELIAAQTPQAFRASVLRAAHAGEPEGTDDAAVVEATGGRVVVVAGELTNFKITDPRDLDRAAGVLADRSTA